MPEHIGPAAGNGFSSGQIESITSVEAPPDGHSATALPNLPVKGESEALTPVSESSDKAPAPSDIEDKKTRTQVEMEKMKLEFAGLTATDISKRINEKFRNPQEPKIDYRPDRNEQLVPMGIGIDSAERAMNLALFNSARQLQQKSAAQANHLRIQHDKQAKSKAVRERKSNIEAARQRVDSGYEKNTLSIGQFKEALSVAEIDKLTSYWEDRGYIDSGENERGELVYRTPKSSQLDKGKLITGNSILDLRQEALDRIAKKSGTPTDSIEPIAPDNEPPTAFEDLVKLGAYDAQQSGDSISSRLSALGKAYEEAGNNSDELERVIGQAFHQGLIKRTQDPDTGKIVGTDVRALSPELDTWYEEALNHYQGVISHSDREQEAEDQETGVPYTQKSAGWFRLRKKIFKRRS